MSTMITFNSEATYLIMLTKLQSYVVSSSASLTAISTTHVVRREGYHNFQNECLMNGHLHWQCIQTTTNDDLRGAKHYNVATGEPTTGAPCAGARYKVAVAIEPSTCRYIHTHVYTVNNDV